MNLREATIADISALHTIRMAVKENALSDPLLVTEADYVEFLTSSGKGWLVEINGEIVGFAIIDIIESNIWALFIKPQFEKRGIGKKLHDAMLNWYFDMHKHTLWLGTAPGTRAEKFYTARGWKNLGSRENGEVKFEMSYIDWKEIKTSASQ